MKLSDFDFDLPDASIALRPAEPRSSAKLLVVRPDQGLSDHTVADLPQFLQPGDALVFNDTRVIPARLFGVRRRGDLTVPVEATLHKRLSDRSWSAFMRPGKRIKVGDQIVFGPQSAPADLDQALMAQVAGKGEGGEIDLEFALAGPALDQAIAAIGLMPLPPYIAAKRAEDARDRADYQTVYARLDGSVAAPTAGLHFTPELLETLKANGIALHFVTLHVGAGTFLPVKTDDVTQHKMHAEFGEVSEQTAEALTAVHAAGRRIICVGTTSLRLLESATDETGRVMPFRGDTAIFIRPGYRFRAADGLMTNFHLPKSTLFMLVSAFAGTKTMKQAYTHAIATGYRFYSYGDSSLLFRAG